MTVGLGFQMTRHAGGSPRAPGRRTGNGMRSRAFLGDTRGGMACEVCGVPLQVGHRALRFPYRQERDVVHAHRVVEALVRGAAPAPIRCPTVKYGAHHPKTERA